MKDARSPSHWAGTVGLVLLGVVLAVACGEVLVRVAAMDQRNYVIEMWRYAGLLKRPSADPAIGHEHVPGSSATLQGVEISINSLGMRGPEPAADAARRIVIIGDSIALGWGVPEADTLRATLDRGLGPAVDVVNDGVGNMNLSQVVAHWERTSARLPVDTVILLATQRAPIVQPPPTGNWLLRHSMLCAVLVTYFETVTSGATGREEMTDAVRRQWTTGPGATEMHAALDRLAAQAAKAGYRVILVAIPEMNDLQDYRFGFMTEILQQEATEKGWDFVDLRPVLMDEPAASYWATEQDIHPNAKFLERAAQRLLPLLR